MRGSKRYRLIFKNVFNQNFDVGKQDDFTSITLRRFFRADFPVDFGVMFFRFRKRFARFAFFELLLCGQFSGCDILFGGEYLFASEGTE